MGVRDIDQIRSMTSSHGWPTPWSRYREPRAIVRHCWRERPYRNPALEEVFMRGAVVTIWSRTARYDTSYRGSRRTSLVAFVQVADLLGASDLSGV